MNVKFSTKVNYSFIAKAIKKEMELSLKLKINVNGERYTQKS